MQYISDEEHFSKVVIPKLQGFLGECKNRKREAFQMKIAGAVIFVFGFLIFIVLLDTEFKYNTPGALFLFFCLAVLITSNNPEKNRVIFKKIFQTSILPTIFSRFGEFVIQSQPSISAENIRDSGLFRKFKYVDIMNQIAGKSEGLTMMIHEFSLLKTLIMLSGSDANIVFRGFTVSCQFHKRFQGKTVIEKDQNYFSDIASNLLDGEKEVRLESDEFEKRFNVFTTDQVEARYLLTPDLMLRLIQISNTFPHLKVEFSFFENIFMMKVETSTELFTPPDLDANPLAFNSYKSIYRQMRAIIDATHCLKLHGKSHEYQLQSQEKSHSVLRKIDLGSLQLPAEKQVS